MRVALALDLDLAKFDKSRFHISIFRWLDLEGNNALIRVYEEAGNVIATQRHCPYQGEIVDIYPLDA